MQQQFPTFIMKRSFFSAISITMMIIFLSLRVSVGKHPMGVAPSVNSGYSVYTLEDLKTMPILHLSICGHVFDVSSGERFYGADGGYKFFGRKDATHAFATGDFAEPSCIDDVSELTADQCVEAQVWLDFFKDHEKYEYVGVMDGYFYNSEAVETAGALKFKECVAKGIKAEKDQKLEAARAAGKIPYPVKAEVVQPQPIVEDPNSATAYISYFLSFFYPIEATKVVEVPIVNEPVVEEEYVEEGMEQMSEADIANLYVQMGVNPPVKAEDSTKDDL
jgi:hypothetical protein|mmetsp:Transcript_3330/g.3503  ORF Transcript_3330/g.3503 Transcript_3330/m.3503 type:complete len:277 (+) Transcript_3330:177-1007(+)|eukprot:CAMPEP_0119036038 /NCGR_PEP_ID=MMETSP1177-20130426/3421_1 /TAXON_ID=2985 /ORGANISM="Ochromonas sp, Strain CCMP1899" /LENGTH=276 /DNA_ID=CAMNT_0006995181 /DNA_START=142 /DNA_END=972 /DNA_ORIENTATION=-